MEEFEDQGHALGEWILLSFGKKHSGIKVGQFIIVDPESVAAEEFLEISVHDARLDEWA